MSLLHSSSDFKEPPTQGLHFQLLPGADALQIISQPHYQLIG